MIGPNGSHDFKAVGAKVMHAPALSQDSRNHRITLLQTDSRCNRTPCFRAIVERIPGLVGGCATIAEIYALPGTGVRTNHIFALVLVI